MLRLLDNGYCCENCGKSVMDDEPESDHYPYCSPRCYKEYYDKLAWEEFQEIGE